MNIQNLINPLMLLPVEDNKLILTEIQNLDKEQTLREVIVTNLPSKTIAYSTDIKLKDNKQQTRLPYNEYLNVPTPLFTRREKVKDEKEKCFWTDDSEFIEIDSISKRSDGIIIYRNDENALSVIICDLKSKKFNLEECSDKFMTDKLFLDYLISILRVIFKEHLTVENIKYVIFYLQTDLADKQGTRITKDDLLKIEEDNMKKYNEKVLKIPFDKTQHNYIEWDKIISY